MQGTMTHRLSTLLLASASVAALSLAWVPSPALAEKVGVTSAVNPDAYQRRRPRSRSATRSSTISASTPTASGLVQVLLVDGSTFTVGPGSDLVIDKFVYDPKKNKGEVVATFSKGMLRFVGGKISKNEGGVKINTPSGALAIRGGMAYISDDLFAFIYGDELVYRSHTAWCAAPSSSTRPSR